MVYTHIQYLMLVVNQQMVIRCSQEKKTVKWNYIWTNEEGKGEEIKRKEWCPLIQINYFSH